jgi:hypothetical protein
MTPRSYLRRAGLFAALLAVLALPSACSRYATEPEKEYDPSTHEMLRLRARQLAHPQAARPGARGYYSFGASQVGAY